MTNYIYIDNFSTTPLSPYALSQMKDAFSLTGNAASPHIAGAQALFRINEARENISNLIGALSSEIFFTSGATEANNLALRGIGQWGILNAKERNRIIISDIEHKSVIETVLSLTDIGFDVVKAPVLHDGTIDLVQLNELINDQTLLVSLMYVNNETGVIQPVWDAVRMTHQHGALFHCDAAQALGKLSIDVLELEVDYLSLSAHKCYGPMGIGALYIAADAPKPLAQNVGGGQERGLRSGTEPVPLIVGFGAAAQEAAGKLVDDAVHSARLSAHFLAKLDAAQVEYRRISGDAPTIPGGFALIFPNISADEIISKVSKTLCISSGSACNKGAVVPSYVFKSMGFSDEEARSIVRFSFSRFNTLEEAEQASLILIEAISALRS